MTPEEKFIQMLRPHSKRMELTARVQANPDTISCYYLCPVTNLKSILQEGIKCQNSVSRNKDLSSSDVQHLRQLVWLGRSTQKSPISQNVPVHNCVNFFWNPLNQTFEAFQRNALIRAADRESAADSEVCVVELDAESLLLDSTMLWGASPKNIAVNSWTTSIYEKLADPKQFDWDSIFAINESVDKHEKQMRAAELIVFSGPSKHSSPVGPRHFRRLIISSRARLDTELQRSITSAGTPLARLDIFKPLTELCKAEHWFLTFLSRFRRVRDKDVAEKIVRAFQNLLAFEHRIGSLNRDPFVFCKPDQAFRHHGIGHVVRVMFWSQFILTYEDSVSVEDQTACGLAALIHDLCRQNDDEDRQHGEDAAHHFADLIRAAFSPINSGRDRSVANASTMHCRPDSECLPQNRDLVWRILKDADALDRGRFGIPNNPGGCDTITLRSEILKNDGAILASVAFHFAMQSKLNHWGSRPCLDLLRGFSGSLKAALRVSALESDKEIELATYLVQSLCPLVEASDNSVVNREIAMLAGLTEEDIIVDDEEIEDTMSEEMLDYMSQVGINDWDDHDCEEDDRHLNYD